MTDREDIIKYGKHLADVLQIDLTEFLDNLFNEGFNVENENLLLCGGAFGHLAHPYEDADLTFDDIKEIITLALSGKLETYEKVDGQNLMITWKDGGLRAARNKGHLKNSGENSLTKDQLDTMFADKPENVRKAFSMAMDDLSVTLSRISPQTLQTMFQNGKRFMNIEVLLPTTQNVIPYGMNILMFHGIIEYDDGGNSIENVDQGAEILYKIVQSVNADVQNTFAIKGPNKVLLSKLKDFPEKRVHYFSMLSNIQNELHDGDKVIKYHIKEWHKIIINKTKELGYEIPSDILNLLIDRWALGKKTTNISQVTKKINNNEFAIWIKEFDKKEAEKTAKKINQPLENLFLKLGVEVLFNASGFLASQSSESAKEIAQHVSLEAEKIRKSGDPESIKKLEYELERIQSIGGLEKLVGSEGVVFYRNGKIYKFTGLFSPINSILGMIKYQRK